MKISVQREDFDLGAEVKGISGNSKVGAVASFVGVVRQVAMSLEHYPGMTENSIRKTQAPFWKKEQTPDGPRWVEARASDDQAAERWKIKPGAVKP
jgi:molybdopterin synthase catalytic subunit